LSNIGAILKKYKRKQIDVMAEQFFPYKKIDIENFKNITEELYNNLSQKVSVVRKAEIKMADEVLEVLPGDWVVRMPDNKIVIRSNSDFLIDFDLAP